MTATVPENVPFRVTLIWTNQAGIVLATLSRVFPTVSSNDTLVVNADEYMTSGEAFDDDRDGAPNVDELRCGSDPSSSVSQPDSMADCFAATAPAGSRTTDIVTSACGSLPITSTVQRPDASDPLAAAAGALYSGMLSDDFSAFYDVPLRAGRYRLVVDVHDVGDVFNSNIVVERLDESGEPIETLIDDADLDKTRFLSVIELGAPETLRLRFREGALGEDSVYTFGLFADGDLVPSPFFTDCPMVIPVSAGIT